MSSLSGAYTCTSPTQSQSQCGHEGLKLEELSLAAIYNFPTPSQMMNIVDQEAVSNIILVLGVLILMLYVLTACLIFLSLVGSHIYMHKKSDTAVLGDDEPGVSIVKPLMGLDPLLEVNLESHFTLQYPKFELLMCCHDDQDPAINLIHRLQEKYPKVDVRLFCNGRDEIMNPMVQNMVQGYDAAKYEYVWISASRIKVSSDILEDMVVKLQQPSVALVHQMPFSVKAHDFASAIEKVYFGCAFARYYIAFSMLGLCCVTGMSYIFKKSILDQLNGLGWYGKYLAEDFFLTKAMHEKTDACTGRRGGPAAPPSPWHGCRPEERGYKFVLSAYPAQQNVSSTSLNSFIERMVRWLRLRLNMLTVVASVLEPLTECLPLGALTAAVLYHFFDINPVYFFLSHLTAWLIVDYIQLRRLQNGPVPIGKLRFVYIWIIREFLSMWIFVSAVCNPHRIKWGKRTYYVHTGGQTELDTKVSPSCDL